MFQLVKLFAVKLILLYHIVNSLLLVGLLRLYTIIAFELITLSFGHRNTTGICLHLLEDK